MIPTNRLAHFKNGSNSILGLPIFTDAAGEEFVLYQNQWTHALDMPLEHSHTLEMTQAKPKRVPQFVTTPVPPPIPAFATTTPDQRAPATKQWVPNAS